MTRCLRPTRLQPFPLSGEAICSHGFQWSGQLLSRAWGLTAERCVMQRQNTFLRGIYRQTKSLPGELAYNFQFEVDCEAKDNHLKGQWEEHIRHLCCAPVNLNIARLYGSKAHFPKGRNNICNTLGQESLSHSTTTMFTIPIILHATYVIETNILPNASSYQTFSIPYS